MKNIHISDSYKTWNPLGMRCILTTECFNQFLSFYPDTVLHRSFLSMYVEWWLHNIGYYVTKPFYFIDAIRAINLRCKDVDLEERWKYDTTEIRTVIFFIGWILFWKIKNMWIWLLQLWIRYLRRLWFRTFLFNRKCCQKYW